MPAEPASAFSFRSFWRSWPAAVRPLLVVAALAFVAALGLSVGAYFTADTTLQPWQPVTSLADFPTPVDTVRVGTLALPVRGLGYVLTQTVLPTAPALAPGAATWYLLLLGLALVGYLAVLPGLGWRPFLVGTGLLIFFLRTFNLDLLGLLPGTGPLAQAALILLLAVLGGTAYALHAFFPQVGPTRRLLLFGLLVGALAFGIFQRSALPAAGTVFHLTGYALSGAIVVSALFILFVAYENIRGILWLTGQAASPAARRGLGAFLVAAGLYLLNLLLLFLDAYGFVHLGGGFLDAFFVLLSSTSCGLFGLRSREAEYGRAVPYLLMAPLYLLLAALTLGTVGYAFATLNDPLIEFFTDAVVATHLAAGVAFTFYVVANFGPLIQRRLQAYKVVFDPKRLPIITVYLITAVGLMALLYRDQLFLLRQASGGYYNAIGDHFRSIDDAELAERYYREADFEVPFNAKANTARAVLAEQAGERQRQENLLRRALRRNPSPKIVARLAALFDGPADFFACQQVLREGLNRFPASPHLNLLMGNLYGRSTLADSTEVYYSRAARRAPAEVTGALLTNRLAAAVLAYDLKQATQLANGVRASDPLAAQSNAVLTGLLARPATGRARLTPTTLGAALGSTDSLTAETFGYVTLRALEQAARHDTVAAPLLLHLADRPANVVYAADLLETRTLLLHAGGEYDRARAAMLERAEAGTGEVAGRRYRTLGQWALQEGLYPQAAAWLSSAADRGDQDAYLYRAMALARAGQLDSARRSIPIIYTSGDPVLKARACYLETVLTAAPTALTSDSARADFVTFRAATESLATLSALTGAIQQPNLRATAAAVVADQALTAGDVGAAYQLLQGVGASVDQLAVTRWLWFETLIRRGEAAKALRQLPAKPSATDPQATGWRLYVTAAAHAALGHEPEAAAAFAQLPRRAPWLTRGLLAAADFFAQHPPKQDPLAAYNTLLTAVRYDRQSAGRWRAYAWECARQGLTDFGADALEQLQRLLPAPEFATFQAEYAERLRQARAAQGFE